MNSGRGQKRTGRKKKKRTQKKKTFFSLSSLFTAVLRVSRSPSCLFPLFVACK